MKHGTLVLIRHGESRMNLENRFTGWIDVPLSKKGLDEAHKVADHCHQFDYNAAFTSHLERAHETLLVILSHQKKIGIFEHEQDAKYHYLKNASKQFIRKTIPIFNSRALNERYYGDLQGLNKNAAVRKYGKEKVFNWRRGYKYQPPNGESLKDVYRRVMPYFNNHIHNRLKQGETILVTAHGNTLRAFIKYLEKIKEDQIPFIDLPTGHPLVYSYSKDGFSRTEGKYKFNRPLR